MPENSSTLDERWRALGSPWRPGMLSLQHWDGEAHPYRCRQDARGFVRIGQLGNGSPEDNRAYCLPDWTDPATLGALLGLVRERYGDPHVYVLSCASDWFTVCSPNAEGGKWLAHPPIDGSTEAEALIAALEAHDGV